MTFWTYANLAAVTHGTWLVEPDDLDAQVAGLWHDTREITAGQAYLAIKGENFDGHAFVDKAFDAGAALAIVQTQPATGHQPPAPLLLVEDTVKALQDLARAYRDELSKGGCKVIGIAGSNGKTTTRHLIHHVLTHAGLKGTQSPKSFNNHLGVPLTLLSAKVDDDFVAAEIGTNHPGEIDFLSAIARPDIAVITSIGEEHLEFFKDLEGVAKEEACILQHVPTDGIALIQDEAFAAINDVVDPAELPATESFGFGEQGSGLRIYLWPMLNNTGAFMIRYMGDEAGGVSSLRGDYNLQNAVAAVGCGIFLGVALQTLIEALETADTPDQRGCVYRFGSSLTVIDDAYNANPSSMRAAIKMLHRCYAAQWTTVAVLGDMFELGDSSDALHHEIAHYRIQSDERRLMVLIGESFNRVKLEPWVDDEFCHIVQMTWTDRTPGDVADLLQPGDTVLLKGSRGMALERLIPAIERRFGPATDDQPT